VLAPIRIYLAGRATERIGERLIPLRDIAVEASRAWLRANLHALDADHHVGIEALIEPGSSDLHNLFGRGRIVPLANDTSIGVGYAPLSALERLVIAAEKGASERARTGQNRAGAKISRSWRSATALGPSHRRLRHDRQISCQP
jgi:S-adenosylmethionine synthetase